MISYIPCFAQHFFLHIFIHLLYTIQPDNESQMSPQEQQKWVQWKLWREKMIGMNSNGEILVYSLLSQFGEPMYKSEPYTVVLYKNPSWIFR